MQNKRSSLNLTRLVKRPLKNKTRIIVTISATGSLPTIKTLRIRNGKEPQVRTTCLEPGASNPSAC